MALARWQSTITDAAGNIVPSASVEVRRESDSALIPLFSDREGTVPAANPLTSDSEGQVGFHVPGGAYRITITAPGQSRTLRYVAIGTAAEADSIFPVAGDVVYDNSVSGLAAEDAQTAIDELASEKLNKASNLADVASPAMAFGNIKQAATTAATGVVELATNAEAVAGTDTARAVTPAGVAAAMAGLRPFLHVRDQKPAGTAGGAYSATTGVWVTRTLNTEVTDGIGSTLGSNQFTLPAGTYEADVRVPAWNVGTFKARLRNVSDGADTLIGSSEDTGGGQTDSKICGRFTIAAQKTFEVQMQAGASSAVSGLGRASNMSVIEIYTEVKIWRIS